MYLVGVLDRESPIHLLFSESEAPGFKSRIMNGSKTWNDDHAKGKKVYRKVILPTKIPLMRGLQVLASVTITTHCKLANTLLTTLMAVMGQKDMPSTNIK